MLIKNKLINLHFLVFQLTSLRDVLLIKEIGLAAASLEPEVFCAFGDLGVLRRDERAAACGLPLDGIGDNGRANEHRLRANRKTIFFLLRQRKIFSRQLCAAASGNAICVRRLFATLEC